jgi:hypothetical protein
MSDTAFYVWLDTLSGMLYQYISLTASQAAAVLGSLHMQSAQTCNAWREPAVNVNHCRWNAGRMRHDRAT